MLTLYRLSIDQSHSLENAWHVFEARGVDICYASEEKEGIEFFVYLSSLEILSQLDWIISCEPHTLPSIDWQEQWAIHGYNFREGVVNIDLTRFGLQGSILHLQPGAGFGDLSHPTTDLMMSMLAQCFRQQIVVDIGCGSGILSLAAIALGSALVYGIDIDSQAIEHSHQNALLNNMQERAVFSLPSKFVWRSLPQPILILMNMIRTEQMVAWSSLSALHDQQAELISSGIRNEEREVYLEQTKEWGWLLKYEQEKEGWLAFYFTNSLNQSL